MEVCKWKAAHSRTVINSPWLTSRGMETWKGKARLVEWNPHNIFMWKEKTQQYLVAVQHNHVIPFPFLHHPVQHCPWTAAILQPMQDKFMTFGHKKPAKLHNYRFFFSYQAYWKWLELKQATGSTQTTRSICTSVVKYLYSRRKFILSVGRLYHFNKKTPSRSNKT